MSDLSKRIEELEKGMVVLNQVISTSEETEAKLRVRIEALKLGQQAIALTYQQEITALKEKLSEANKILGMLRKECEIGADGTNLKCTCGRKDCYSMWLNAGDLIYRVYYTDRDAVKEHLASIAALDKGVEGV